jgi:hypothetical protein
VVPAIPVHVPVPAHPETGRADEGSGARGELWRVEWGSRGGGSYGSESGKDGRNGV